MHACMDNPKTQCLLQLITSRGIKWRNLNCNSPWTWWKFPCCQLAFELSDRPPHLIRYKLDINKIISAATEYFLIYRSPTSVGPKFCQNSATKAACSTPGYFTGFQELHYNFQWPTDHRTNTKLHYYKHVSGQVWLNYAQMAIFTKNKLGNNAICT